MGRKHSTNRNLPNGMRARKRQRKNKIITYYFYEMKIDGKRKEISLGTDYVLAVKQWAKLEQDKIKPQDRAIYNQVVLRYQVEVIEQAKSNYTRRNKLQNLKSLNQFFDGAPLDDITPQHIRQYYNWRADTPAEANNEISTFSHLWNKAREWGYTDKANPCTGIKGYEVQRRDFYVENDLYQFVYDHANQEIKDLMDIAYLIGQRPIDIVNIHSKDIKEGVLSISQSKTKAKLRFEISGSLKTIFDRIMPKQPDFLFKNKRNKHLTRERLTKWFKTLRDDLIAQYPEYENDLKSFEFRDLRAKSATDVFLSETLTNAQQQLGHTNERMTKTYIRKPKTQLPIQATPIKIAEQAENCGTNQDDNNKII